MKVEHIGIQFCRTGLGECDEHAAGRVRQVVLQSLNEVDVRRRMLLRVWPFMRVKLCVAQVGLPSARC